MQVGTGILGIDVLADIRDVSADFAHWEWSWGHAGQTILDVVGIVPLIGAVKYTDEAGSLLKPAFKYGDELAIAGGGTIKQTEEVAEHITRITKENILDQVDDISKSGRISNLDDGLNFSNRALEHMGESGRQVPIQTLQDAIRYGEAMPDPRGSNATMYYTTMYKNGKMYNLEVLYDEISNTVYHFEYARKAMGNLPAIPK